VLEKADTLTADCPGRPTLIEKAPMRIRSSLAIAGGVAAGLSACAGRIAHQQLYAARYNASLAEVARTPTTKQRYGAIAAITSGDSSRFKFEDGLIAAQVGVLPTAVRIRVQNKTDQSIKVIWDEASFIDVDGTLSRIMHVGVKYADRNSSQPPTVIPAHQRLADDLFPTNRVWYRQATARLTAGYQNGPLLVPAYTISQQGEPASAPLDSFSTAVRSHVGRRFAIVIPFEADGVKNEYTLWFRVDDAAVKALAPTP